MSQAVVGTSLLCIWLVFIVYWAISAIGVKRDIKRTGPAALALIVRLIIITAALVYFSNNHNSWIERFVQISSHIPLAVQIVGLVLCAAGIAFAIWARIHLGRNWSPVPALKENHELVTSGPYRFVRNPIYTGILVALFGSALAAGFAYWIVFIVCLAVFTWRVYTEDRLMLEQFPETYPPYRQRTKALIPYVV